MGRPIGISTMFNGTSINLRDRSIAHPSAHCIITVGTDLFAITKQCRALGLLFDSIHYPIKLSGFAIRREHFTVQQIKHAALKWLVCARNLLYATHSHNCADYYYAKVHRLLCCSSCLFSCRELSPLHQTIIISHGHAPCAARLFAWQAVICSVGVA